MPPAPNGTLNHYQSWSFYATNDTYGDVRVEYDLLTNVTAYAKFGARKNNGSYLLDFPTINNLSGATSSSSAEVADLRRETLVGSGLSRQLRDRFPEARSGAQRHMALDFSGSSITPLALVRFEHLCAIQRECAEHLGICPRLFQ